MKHYVTFEQLNKLWIYNSVSAGPYLSRNYLELKKLLPESHTKEDPIDLMTIFDANGIVATVMVLEEIISPLEINKDLYLDLIDSVYPFFKKDYPKSTLVQDILGQNNNLSEERITEVNAAMKSVAPWGSFMEPEIALNVVKAAVWFVKKDQGLCLHHVWQTTRIIDMHNSVHHPDGWRVGFPLLREAREAELRVIFAKHFS